MDNKKIIIKGVISSETVLAAVTKVTGISTSRIVSESRLWPVAEARMISVLALNRLGLTDTKTAWILNRGRSNVCKIRHTALNLLEYSKTFRDKLQKVQTIINPQKDEE